MIINHIIREIKKNLPQIYKVKKNKKIKKDKSIVTMSDIMVQNIVISVLKKTIVAVVSLGQLPNVESKKEAGHEIQSRLAW